MANQKTPDDEQKLFRQMMQDVIPLRKQTPREDTKRPPPSITKPRKQEPQQNILSQEACWSNPYDITVAAHDTLHYERYKLSPNRLKQLKQGLIAIEARLDLHGLQLDVARTSLSQFLIRQRQQGNRCMLIIHGKGGKYGEQPVLKNHVNHWLQQYEDILAFHSAIPRDGGVGAVYVLLRKKDPHAS
jgi:DNA-nicking Smr family endonuclease